MNCRIEMNNCDTTTWVALVYDILTSPSSSSSCIPLPLVDLWRLFRSFDARFPSKYVAYHYYRSRGWVPRCGLKFGVDFLLYVHGPKDYHATFSLVVEELDHRLRPVSIYGAFYFGSP